jgi:hypothetical protein
MHCNAKPVRTVMYVVSSCACSFLVLSPPWQWAGDIPLACRVRLRCSDFILHPTTSGKHHEASMVTVNAADSRICEVKLAKCKEALAGSRWHSIGVAA